MSMHTFDPKIAQEVGIPAAVIFQNIRFWVAKNAAFGSVGRHYRDGAWWTYHSIKGMALLFPYLTENQVRRAIDRLVEVGLIEAGNYNKLPFDRTRWFRLCRPLHLAELPNGRGEDATPIPDVTSDITTDSLFGSNEPHSALTPAAPFSKQDSSTSERRNTREEIDATFDRFWQAYPKRTEKKAAKAKFIGAIRREKIDPEILIRAAAAYAQTDSVKRGYAKNPTTWLNGGCWEDEGIAPRSVHPEADKLRREAVIERTLGNYQRADDLEARAKKIEAQA
jgi:hypothetical protein